MKTNEFQAGYQAALNDIARQRYLEGLQRANQDPTGQDLDDFIGRNCESDEYSHTACNIQAAEMRFGA